MSFPKKTEHIVDVSIDHMWGHIERVDVAVRYDDGAWIDPYGGTFTEKQLADLSAFAAGTMTADEFGVPGLVYELVRL